ncbi:MAG: NADH-quinone oxidoreductase subunit NuoF [Candidatus Eiseniibacteriota bacterium]|nr:MAG: NADH-quinone oxidoreductase subunit NuoF [Candidatus Eisenbacteria bacterium]
MAEKILLNNIDRPGSERIDTYLSQGGYAALKKALETMKPEEVTKAVKASGLRGRGGAGFPTGLKWSFVPKAVPGPRYLCCNADEGEPGTFKDRVIIEKDPHLLLEGIAISCYALSVEKAYIYIRGEFVVGAEKLTAAISEAESKGYLGRNILGSGFSLDLHVHRGAGSYICGEETALLESLEGKRGHPRLKPPFPASVGLYGQPTVINNVETLANVPAIVARGAEWFASLGTKGSTGTKLFAVSGHVEKPGVYELPLGVSLRELLFEHAGGMRQGRKLKAVMPGGSSTPVITSEHLDVALDFDSLAAAGTMLGSGAVIVMDDTTCMVEVALRLTRFYKHESCGQCTPCREGLGWLEQLLEGLESGKAGPGDIELLLEVSSSISGKTLCPMGDAAVVPVESTVSRFREEYELHLREKRCPLAGSRAGVGQGPH